MESGTLSGRVGGGDAGLTVVAGRRFVAAVGGTAAPEVIAALTASVAGSARLETIVGAVPTAGPTAVADFAVVIRESRLPDAFTVLARGALEVELDGGGRTRRFESGGIVPFHLAEFAGVDAFRIHRTGTAAGDRPATGAGGEPIPFGVARRVDDVDWRSSKPAPAPAAPAPPAEPAPRRGTPVRYRIDDGPARPLDGPVRIGRAPRPERVDGEATTVVAVPGAPTVSGTHLEIRREGTRLIARDLGSSNGTTLIRGAERTPIRPGSPHVVEAGARLQLGDDTIVEILPNPEERPA